MRITYLPNYSVQKYLVHAVRQPFIGSSGHTESWLLNFISTQVHRRKRIRVGLIPDRCSLRAEILQSSAQVQIVTLVKVL